MPYTDPRFRAYLHYGWLLAWTTRGYTRRKMAPKYPSLNDIAYAICVVSPPVTLFLTHSERIYNPIHNTQARDLLTNSSIMDGGQLEPAKKSIQCEENRLRNTNMPSKEDFMCDVENSEGAQTLYSDVIAVFSNVPWLEPGMAPQRFEGMTEEEQELCDGARARTVAAVARAATGRQQVAAAAAAAAAARRTALAARSSPSSSGIAPSGTASPARDEHWELCRNAKLEARRLREFMANQKLFPPRLDFEKEALKVAMSCHHASENLIKAEERGEKTAVRERLMVKLHQAIEALRAAEEKLRAELVVRRAAALSRRSAAERLAAAAPENGQERERGDGEEGEGGDGEEGERGNGEEGNGEEGERREGEEDDDYNGGQYDFQDDDPDGSQVSKDDIMATQQGL